MKQTQYPETLTRKKYKRRENSNFLEPLLEQCQKGVKET